MAGGNRMDMHYHRIGAIEFGEKTRVLFKKSKYDKFMQYLFQPLVGLVGVLLGLFFGYLVHSESITTLQEVCSALKKTTEEISDLNETLLKENSGLKDKVGEKDVKITNLQSEIGKNAKRLQMFSNIKDEINRDPRLKKLPQLAKYLGND
jgi:gas vesicle protein